jgi:predicted transcriptional regulator
MLSRGGVVTTSTTLKLPEALKKRIAPLAEASGVTPHAWMVEALESQAALAERRKEFVEDALASIADQRRSGALYAAEDVREYFIAKATGGKPRRPKPVGRR